MNRNKQHDEALASAVVAMLGLSEGDAASAVELKRAIVTLEGLERCPTCGSGGANRICSGSAETAHRPTRRRVVVEPPAEPGVAGPWRKLGEFRNAEKFAEIHSRAGRDGAAAVLVASNDGAVAAVSSLGSGVGGVIKMIGEAPEDQVDPFEAADELAARVGWTFAEVDP